MRDPIRHSGTIQEFGGERFSLCGKYFQRQGVRLHRKVWEAANGPVPDGIVIHHRNHDRSDNRLENLEAMTASEHAAHHLAASEPRRPSEQALEKAAEWHRSEVGRDWHRRHYEETREALHRTVAATCLHCGETYSATPTAKYCSPACGAAARRRSGVDDEGRVCLICGAGFRVNRYWSKATCSRSCGGKLSALRRSGNPVAES